MRRTLLTLCLGSVVVTSSCVERPRGPVHDGGPGYFLVAERLFPTVAQPVASYPACHFASPLAYESPARGTEVLLAVGESIVGVDPLTGAAHWTVTLPAPDGEMAMVVGTPYLEGDSLVVGYHTTATTTGLRDVLDARLRQRVAVLDLRVPDIDPAFPVVDLHGEADTVDADAPKVVFDPGQALGRAALAGARMPGDVLGKVYVTFGNARDILPWHGFAFEVDLDAWLAGGADAAITGFFVDTPETSCGTPGQSGSRERICGGGLWAPSGPVIVPDDAGYVVVLASGNGQLDLARRDHANTLMRVRPGLAFDPGCDPDACAGFDPDAPSDACMASCERLHIPRMPAGEDFASLTGGRCDGLGLFECWAKFDYVGGSSPAYVATGGFELLVYPAKDGAVYLVDARHLGTQYERRQLVPICGTGGSSCRMDWAGMIVTQPTLTELDGAPLALVPTFMPDGSQEAGVFALKVVVRDGAPAFEEAWRWPPAEFPEAKERFRTHPSRVALATIGGHEVALVVEPQDGTGGPGRLLALDVATGAPLLDAPLAGSGYRFVMPLVLDDRVYLPSCATNAGVSFVEAHRLAIP